VRARRYGERAASENIRPLRVVRIRWVIVPDADLRLSRAVDIVLRYAIRESQVGINAGKEKKVARDSRPKRLLSQRDGDRDES
jgi:hypothetical protein